MNVLSLFDGMSCGQIALNRAGIKYEKYYASEIDKYAITVTQANYPNTIQLGSITDWQKWDIEKPDLIMGGSPCQGFSFAGKQLNFNDERSKLFFTFVDILKHYKPRYFLLENVVMKKEYNDVISGLLGELYPECVTNGELFRTGRLEPIQINSALVSAQNRKRLYWTNIQGIEQPKDKGILLKYIIESGCTDRDKSVIHMKQLPHGNNKGFNKKTNKAPSITSSRYENNNLVLCRHIGNADIKGNDAIKRVYGVDSKSPCLTTMQGGHQEPKISEDFKTWRKLTPIECERLQTVPDNYTNHVSNSQRYKMLGNGWTVDVIAHIFSYIA
jgi:site-specific DNA-cytosine methylase